MIRALLLCALAAPAYADEYRWNGEPQSYVETFPGEGNGHVATLVAVNRTNLGYLKYITFTLHEGGIAIGVRYDPAPGAVPDRITVTPPDGYISIPSTLLIDENSEGTFEIFEASEVPIG